MLEQFKPIVLPTVDELLAEVGGAQNFAESIIIARMQDLAKRHDAADLRAAQAAAERATMHQGFAEDDRTLCYVRLAAYAKAIALYREHGAEEPFRAAR